MLDPHDAAQHRPHDAAYEEPSLDLAGEFRALRLELSTELRGVRSDFVTELRALRVDMGTSQARLSMLAIVAPLVFAAVLGLGALGVGMALRSEWGDVTTTPTVTAGPARP
jgi:hypothetical protein